MRVLLVGPYPPPHGGISVHVLGIERHLAEAGVSCQVLDTSRVRSWIGFSFALLHYAMKGWTVHFHTNGHNGKSWLLALWCGIVGQCSENRLLTLHSGMAPGYMLAQRGWRRYLMGLTCRLYSRVICVSTAIRDAVVLLGLPADRTDVAPAFLETESRAVVSDRKILEWLEQHQPLFSTALFFRPEYGFELLVTAVARLRLRYPSVGCLVMGIGEQELEAKKLVCESGLENHIWLSGDIDHDACLALISRSDVYVRPTLSDGDSISVREALALGVPVVASRVGTRPAGAILFEPGDLTDLLSKIDSALAVEKVSPAFDTGYMDRLMEIYRQVMTPGESYVSG